jgi:hypothetical protein
MTILFKIQMFLKKKIFFLFVLLSTSIVSNQFVAKAQEIEDKLPLGDKAFHDKDFPKAFIFYKDVWQQKKYTDAMLLKMAFIKEGNKEYAESLYYLQLYYAKNTQESVLQKIIEIAEDNKFKGHKPSDIRYLFFLFDKYFVFLLAFSVLFVAGASVFLYLRSQKGYEILFPTILLGLFTCGFLYVYDFGKPKNRCIVKQKAMLMESPSAGATQVDMIEQGNCLEIKGKKDIWYKVNYNDKDAYIRESNLWLLP